MSVIGAKSSASAAAARSTAAPSKRLPRERGFGSGGALRRGRHAAEGDPGVVDDRAAFSVEPERAHTAEMSWSKRLESL